MANIPSYLDVIFECECILLDSGDETEEEKTKYRVGEESVSYTTPWSQLPNPSHKTV